MSTCTSQDNSLNFLKKKNIIDQERRLQISPEAFELMQQKLIDFAKQEYGYDNGNFYTIETSERKAIQGHNYHRDNKVTIHRIVPVEENFKVLDNLRVSNDEDVAFSLDFFEDTIEEQQEIEPSFETFIKYKQTLKRRINKRLAKIKADKKKFASDKEQLSRLVALEKELTTRLEGDESLGIIGLEGEIGMLLDTPTIEKINFYAEKDLTRLEALSNSENPEDLVEAKTIVNFYEALGTFSTATDNPLFTIDQMFNENGELLLPESTIETLNKLKETVIAQKNKIYQKEKTFVENFINENSKIQNITEGEGVTYEQAFYTKEGLKDTTWIDMFVMDITNGIFSHNGIVPQVMYSTLQEDMEKHLVYAKSVEARMNELQPKVEKILLEKGYKVPWTKKGVSYDLFRAKTSGGLTQDSVTQRYSSVYNEARNKMVSKFSEEIEKARQIDNAVQRSVAFKNANSKRLNWYRKNTIVIDIRKIPELAEINKELNGPILDFPGHKDKLIEVLGEKGYAEEVENQRKLLKEFQTNAEVFKESLLEKEGVSDIESLSKEGQIELEDWNNRHNPYLMVESYYSSEPIKSKITGRETSPNMTYN